MARADYFQSSFPAPWVVLGLDLRPFSLGHYIKLRALECAFVSDATEQATLGDLLIGVIVCHFSTDPDPSADPFWNWLNRPARFNLLAWLFRKTPLTPAEREVYKMGKKLGKIDFAEKVKLFSDYIKAHTQEPGYWKLKEEGDSRSGAHWSHAVVSALCSECGYTQREALNAPMNRALQDYYRAAENHGHVRLMTADELRMLDGG